MKRQISISIILAILVIALAWLYIKFSNDTQLNDKGVLTKEQNETENAIEISQTYISYPYYIKDDNGRLVVYEAKTQNIYAQTGIETNTLPAEIQLHLDVGIFFENEEDLYNFLESYSS
jgi:hypothetical protein